MDPADPPLPPTPVGAARDAIIRAAIGRVTAELGVPIQLAPRRLERRGDWAFLLARMADPAGRPLSFAGTPLADAAREGMVSRDAAVLLRLDGDWTVVDAAIAPTDVAWEGWAATHGAPVGLFG